MKHAGIRLIGPRRIANSLEPHLSMQQTASAATITKQRNGYLLNEKIFILLATTILDSRG